MNRIAVFALLVSLSLPGVGVAAPAPAQDKPRIPPAEYGRFERLGGATLSPDGAWLAYGIARVDGESELRVRSLTEDEESVRTFAWASAPRFSDDSRWLAWSVGMSPDERERLAAAQEPIRNGAGLLELDSGEERSFESVASLAFDATGRFLVLAGYPPEQPEGKGASLRLIDLSDGTETHFGNVAEYAWSDTGSRLAMAVSTGEGSESGAGNGVQLFDAATGTLRTLDSSGATYRGLSWREEAADLAVLRSAEPGAEPGDRHEILAWRGLDADRSRHELGGVADGIADDLMIVAHGSLRWSDDGTKLAFGLRPAPEEEPAPEAEEAAASGPEDGQPDEPEGGEGEPGPQDEEEPAPEDGQEAAPEEEEPELPGVQIWHTADVDLFAAQRVAADRNARRTLLAVWHLDEDRAVKIGTDLRNTAALIEGWEHAIERTSEPYSWGEMFGRPYQDVWRVDVSSGDREVLLERVRYAWTGTSENRIVTFDGDDYHAVDLGTGERTNLTADLDAEFANVRYDTPTDLLPPWWFFPTWSADGEAVLVTDRYDVWRLELDGGGAERLTRGAEEEIEHRVLDLDSEEPGVDLSAPLWFSLRGEITERRGFARLDPGASEPERLLYEDAMLRSLARADDADVYVYRRESRVDSPDLFVGDAELAGARQVTETNPFADEYAWGRAELVNFESEWGESLQAALLYPVNHDPSRRYPMIVYTYEILAPQIHFWQAPSERDYYSFAAWQQEGYFVLLPDIRYRAREPGPSAIAAVRPAVQMIVDRGLVDSESVGLVGHSWGGYQATYLPTRIDTFAASVAGAPLTDFVSFMGALHWNPGIAELSHWETGQARMEVPYWEDPEAHHRSSPIHGVHEMETPLLMAFGDADGVVDWDQGTEFFNFARRAGKQMVLLVYEGEDHGFRNEPNQIDYHRRILEWFGHYLKGEPAPAWITEGIAYDELDAEKERVAKGESGEGR